MKQQVNLYVPELRPVRQRLSAGTCAVLVVLVAVLVLAAMAYGNWQNRQLAGQADAIERQTTQLQQAVETLSAQVEQQRPDPELELALERVTDTISRRQRLLERVEGLTGNHQAGFSGRMAALARQIPENLWLTGITLESSPASFKLEGRTRAPELVPGYLEQLGNEPVFAGETFRHFQLSRPDEEENTGWVEFRMATEHNRGASE